MEEVYSDGYNTNLRAAGTPARGRYRGNKSAVGGFPAKARV